MQKAADLNISAAVMDSDPDAPAKYLCSRFVNASFKDYDSVYSFGKSVDLLTIEIEHVNTDALFKLEEEGLSIYPQPSVIRLVQDKGSQKEFYKKNNFPTAEFELIGSRSDLKNLK